jgi:hypothetical protein
MNVTPEDHFQNQRGQSGHARGRGHDQRQNVYGGGCDKYNKKFGLANAMWAMQTMRAGLPSTLVAAHACLLPAHQTSPAHLFGSKLLLRR